MSLEYYQDLILQRSQSQGLLLSIDGKPVMLPVRMPNQGHYVIVDFINFVVGMDDLQAKDNRPLGDWVDALIKDELQGDITPHDKIMVLDRIAFDIGQRLASIFGEDIDDIFANLHYTNRGLHSYKYCFNIGSPENPLGKVCFGGQNNTCLIMLTGLGCAMACTGWEASLYEFLTSCKKAHITRIDLAHDDFTGAYSSVVDADQAETDGFFYLSGTKPKVQQLGDWKYNTGDGRTLQIGRRQNGKMFRGYEKGRQLGDTDSPWFRAEVELRNQGREIPFDILINPTEYFAGFYPYTAKLIDDCIAYQRSIEPVEQTSKATTVGKAIRIPLIVKMGEISLKKSLDVWKKQVGRYIKFYRDFFQNDTAILDLLQTDKKHDYYPKRLSILEKFKSSEFCASLAGHMPMYA